MSIPVFRLSCSVRDMVREDGSWDLNYLNNILNQDQLRSFISEAYPSDYRGRDMCVWGRTSDGEFTVKSAYISRIKSTLITIILPKSRNLISLRELDILSGLLLTIESLLMNCVISGLEVHLGVGIVLM